MNTMNTDNTSRPFGYWLKAVDRLMAAEFATAFESEGATRRDWRLLNVVDGTVDTGRPLHAHKLRRLIELGWISEADGTWSLTDEGRAAKERLGRSVEQLRAKVAGAVSDDDLATTLASLEQIARAFGWDESTPLPRGRGREGNHGRRPGFGRGRHGFGGHRGFGGRPGFGGHPGSEHGDDWHGFEGHAGCEHGHGPAADGHRSHGHDDHHGRPSHREHGPRRFAHVVQHSYERGFDAGFTRGREA